MRNLDFILYTNPEFSYNDIVNKTLNHKEVTKMKRKMYRYEFKMEHRAFSTSNDWKPASSIIVEASNKNIAMDRWANIMKKRGRASLDYNRYTDIIITER